MGTKTLRLLFLDFNLPYLMRDADYPIGGATIEWNAWINGLLKKGVQVGVLTWKGAGQYVNRGLPFDLIEAYGIDEGVRRIRWISTRYPRLLSATRRYRPDFILQECAGLTTGVLSHIGRKLRIPFVYRVANDMDVDHRHKERLSMIHQCLYRYGLRNSAALLCQNTYQYTVLKRRYPHKKIGLIHNPYYYQGVLPRIRARSDRGYVAWMGVFQQQKNLPALYKIASNAPHIQFRIAGRPGGNVDDSTLGALSRLKMLTNVVLVGYLRRSEIYEFLSGAYALLNTSHYEGFSNTFLESFLMGTPVVVARNVDPDDIIASNRLGAVADHYGEVPDLLDALTRSRGYEEMTEGCRSYVLAHHDPVRLAGQFIEYLLVNCAHSGSSL